MSRIATACDGRNHQAAARVIRCRNDDLQRAAWVDFDCPVARAFPAVRLHFHGYSENGRSTAEAYRK